MSLSIAALISILFLAAGHAGGTPSADEGFGIDPNGRAASAVACDAGSQMDPNGCPRRASSDSSVIVDPNGRTRSSQAGIRADQNG
jgi:hypothetical protein